MNGKLPASLPPDPKTYRMRAHCSNCGWSGMKDFPKGYAARCTTEHCPHCECMGTLVFSSTLREGIL